MGPSIYTTYPQSASRRRRASVTMMNKRKREDNQDRLAKRQRRRLRSNSEPYGDADQAEKKVALKRLFGRVCSVELDRRGGSGGGAGGGGGGSEGEGAASDGAEEFPDENEDPLLDSVPVDMDPEQLGFLVCAQETLRFLHSRGMSSAHPMFARLRSRFLRGISEMGLA